MTIKSHLTADDLMWLENTISKINNLYETTGFIAIDNGIIVTGKELRNIFELVKSGDIPMSDVSECCDGNFSIDDLINLPDNQSIHEPNIVIRGIDYRAFNYNGGQR